MKAGQVLPVPGELVFELLLGQLQATKKIKQEMPKTSVMMVTMHENSDYLFEAVKAGAAGYVLKDASGERLLGAVRRTRPWHPILKRSGQGQRDLRRADPDSQEVQSR